MEVNRIAGFSYEGQGGNPAGVLITDTMLSDENMLSIAKEINYSETAFLVPLENKSFRIRYFSPEMEIGFCGHATIASGHDIFNTYGSGTYKYILNDGSIDVNVDDKKGVIHTSIRSVETKTTDMNEDVLEEFINLFNFEKSDLDSNYPVKVSFSGNYHLILVLKDKKILSLMEYDFEKAKELTRKHNITTISLIYRESENLFHSRNPFAYGGVYEDPATGSAAIAFAEYLRATKIKESGSIEILQGFDMGVPSKLYATYSDMASSPITISGECRIINEDKK